MEPTHTHTLPLVPSSGHWVLRFQRKQNHSWHLPGGHRHWKRLTLSTHCPLFTQGLLWHSLISNSQCTPLKPEQKKWTTQEVLEREKGLSSQKSKFCKKSSIFYEHENVGRGPKDSTMMEHDHYWYQLIESGAIYVTEKREEVSSTDPGTTWHASKDVPTVSEQIRLRTLPAGP